MAKTDAQRSSDEECVTIQLRVTFSQLREINRCAGVDQFDGRARREFILGCVFGEPREELLERVHEIRDAERARFRAELAAERQKRDKARRREPSRRG